MRIRISTDLEREIKKLKRRNPKLFHQIEKQLMLFVQNPRHPSLRIHKLIGKYENMWSISINLSIRIIYVYISGDEVLFVDMGTHEEVYKKG